MSMRIKGDNNVQIGGLSNKERKEYEAYKALGTVEECTKLKNDNEFLSHEFGVYLNTVMEVAG